MKFSLFLFPFLLSGTSYLLAEDELLIPLTRKHSGENPQVFTFVSSSKNKTTYAILNSFTLCDFPGSQILKPGGGFRNLCGDLFFLGATPFSSLSFKNLHLSAIGSGVFSEASASFENLRTLLFTNTSSYGGAISAKGDITFKKNHSIEFLNNRSLGSGGAILLSGPRQQTLTFQEQQGGIVFTQNTAISVAGNSDSGNGGAICSTHPGSKVLFQGNREILFQQNSGTLGGAINVDLGSLKFLNNLCPVSFLDNHAQSGGAIHATTCCFLSQKGPITFEGNRSEKSGGAICSQNLLFEDNDRVLFNSNSSLTGGAISALTCSLIAKGNITFMNNTSKTSGGGAISLSGTAPSLFLHAKEGDIIFSHNIMTTDTKNSSTQQRNAIYIKNAPASQEFLASKGQRILFYDPILSTTLSTKSLVFNKPKDTTTYTGSIVFSGANLSEEEKKNNANKTSILNQPLGLYDGTLSLEGEATLIVMNFSQYGGVLALGPGTLLSTKSSDQPGFLQISRLGFNLENTSSTLPAKIRTTGDAKILLSGNPEIYDPHGLFYENHEKASSQYTLSIIISSGKEITLLDAPLPPLHSLAPKTSQPLNFSDREYSGYGYQGYWKFSWSEKDTKKQKTLMASWIPTGEYILDPQRKGILVPTTLWSTFSGLHAARNALLDSYHNNSSVLPIKYLSIFASPISSIMEQDSSSSLQGFSVKYGGHSLGFRLPYSPNTMFCGEFSQLYGQTSLKNSQDKSSSKMLMGMVAFVKSWEALSLSSSFSYAEDSQFMKTPSLLKLSQGSWRNQGWVGSLGIAYAYPRGVRYVKITPFAHLESTFLKQTPFIETGYDPRYFASSELYTLSLPAGFALELRFLGKKTSALIQASLAYIKDLYRNNPSSKATLILNQYGWDIPEVAIGKEAMTMKIHTVVKHKAISTYIGITSTQRENGNISGDAHIGLTLGF
ncbi:polymorphic outer membrane protein middle domain-containing protein [Chlamydia pecorum]|uniref:polymorphic outer membrane protein middle domain-containing protein n=1 Tax=Chlamydia pecorum TaxID=85991 RepID=UPI0003ADCDDE|nr:polymorphic outer membrane protein middle domain-containing protein [Chlamydia pecorum]AGW39556.1 polymoprphic membrane protein [Chlamydia pecorum P787]